jgi:hypothetical protein
LVVALGIGDCLLAVAPVCQGEDEVAHVPVNVFLLLQPFNVEVRYGHGEAVVKANASKRKRHAETRHSRYILSDGDAVGVECVQQLVGEHQVHDTFLVDAWAKVLVVAAGEAPEKLAMLMI